MGILMNKICCIDNNEIFENTNFKNTLNDTYRNEDDPSLCSNPSSELKSLPFTDINLTKDPKMTIKSLSRLPISTKNVIRQKSGNPFDYYRILKKLGQGTFGQVYKTIHKKTGNIRAMKIIPKNNAKVGFTDKDIIHEIMIMKNLDHPHVIKLYEFYTDEYNYYLINEFCTEGDLSEKMYKLKSLPEPIVKIIMAQIFNAVLYLNNKGIIHGDLKLENILVDSYLDYGNKNEKKEKSTFIASLIQDAKDIKNYLANNGIRRSTSHFYNNFKSKFMNDNEKKIESNKMDIIQNINNQNNQINNQRKTLNFDLLSLAKLKSDKALANYNGNDYNNNEEKKEDNINQKKENNDDSIISEKTDNLNDSSFDESDSLRNSLKKKNSPKQIDENHSTPIKITKKIDNNFNQNEIKKKINIFKSLPINNEENKEYTQCQTETNLTRKVTYNYNKLKIKNFELKLIDFGCSKMFTQYRRTFEDTIGTLVYCSPEVLKNNYNQKCDIWSCGVIMYILLSGKYPFYGSSEEEITKKILVGNFNFDNNNFKNVSDNAKDLIKKCLIHDKNKRITVRDALKHEFFAGEIDINNIFEDEIDTKNVLINLKNNSRKISKFYQTVLVFLSYNFADKEELKKLRKIFYKIDLNLDGKLSKEELFLAYKEAGIKIDKKELEKLINLIDFDGNGSIEYEEFIRVTLPKEQLFTDLNLKTAFDMFDLDKNGTISMNEILEVIGADKEIDKSVIDQLKAEILNEGDEEIDFKRFKEIMLELI